MKKMIFAVLLTAALAGAGCVKTVSGTHAFATTIGQDSFGARYQRSMDQVYSAAISVIQANGVLLDEYIPHDNTNTVRSMEGRVNERNVWIRVEAVDPRITSVKVEARTKWGTRDLDLVHELDKEIALQLAR